MDLGLIFLTGLTIGGLSCLAVQGGLLASIVANRKIEENNVPVLSLFPIGAFLISKLIAHIILGTALGFLGARFAFSDQIGTIIQILAGIYMIIVGLNLLNIHPIFRYVIFTPPKNISKYIWNTSKSKDLFAPALLGVLTVFIPCGTTLAMEALAISTKNPLQGALIMGVFTLGTFPLFFSIGYLTSSLTNKFRKTFSVIAAFLIIYLGVLSLNGALVILNSPITLQKVVNLIPFEISIGGQSSELVAVPRIENNVQVFDIKIGSEGYTPRHLVVSKNQPVRLNLQSSGVYSCASAFRIPSLGIAKDLRPVDNDSVEFTPLNSGQITFACSMGMYDGVIEVI